VHRQVRSELGSPVAYSAFDRDLQMWVAACLFVGLEDTYQLLRGRLTDELAEQFYRSASTLGTSVFAGGVRQSVSAQVHPSGRQPPATGRRAQANPPPPQSDLKGSP
jgi:uncharacterized protein (DUF2236 family)